jgi:hypothetical protein
MNNENVKMIVEASLLEKGYDGLTDGEYGDDCCSCIVGDTNFMSDGCEERDYRFCVPCFFVIPKETICENCDPNYNCNLHGASAFDSYVVTNNKFRNAPCRETKEVATEI